MEALNIYKGCSNVVLGGLDRIEKGRGKHMAVSYQDGTQVNYLADTTKIVGPTIQLIVVDEAYSLVTVDIHPEKLRRLAKYLSNEERLSSLEGFDCTQFLRFIEKISGRRNTILNTKQFNPLKIQNIDELNAGDWVAITTENKTIKHYAMYVGEELFLSKFGSSKLIACDLKELHKLYSCTKTYKLNL